MDISEVLKGHVRWLIKTFNDVNSYDILLVPGGKGTRSEVSNVTLLNWIRRQSESAKFITSVCTGSALLARSGLLDGKKATTNKNAFHWVKVSR